MASKSRLVNLDAMIPRADFAIEDTEKLQVYENIPSFSLKDLTTDGYIRPYLRKPDFQRETNHWVPEQVVSLLECFINGDLIPSVIIWKSPSYFFVIDGGHRLSALQAWIEDDYGDGPFSREFFGDVISQEQKRAANQTRDEIAKKIGTWQHFQSQLKSNIAPQDLKKYTTAVSRGLHIQWVQGDAEKAEASFFKINTKGTPLDDIEELLLLNRKKPIAIASRSIIRSGMEHKYWSRYGEEKIRDIENISRSIHDMLFKPEFNTPIKTLDLPLGGPTGIRNALRILIDLVLIANQDHTTKLNKLSDQDDDDDGEMTYNCLKNTYKLVNKVTGNDRGSLGLHPAIYFYGPTGHHSIPMFLGISTLLAGKIVNNDQIFFDKFINVTERLENILIHNKEVIANIMRKTISKKRTKVVSDILENTIKQLNNNVNVNLTEQDLIGFSGLEGKIIVGNYPSHSENFSIETKSYTFIKTALSGALKCSICKGYLDPSKSMSYDHIVERNKGGIGNDSNCQLTHPYCNQSFKNKGMSIDNGLSGNSLTTSPSLK